MDCTAKWPHHTLVGEATGCNLAVEGVEAGCNLAVEATGSNLAVEAGCNLLAEEGDAVLVGWTWSTCVYWSTRMFGELLVET